MGRGEGARSRALVTPPRGPAPATGALFPDDEVRRRLQEVGWGWRRANTIVWERGGVGLLRETRSNGDVRVGVVYCRGDQSGVTSLFEACVSERSADRLGQRLQAVAERLLVLKAGGWELESDDNNSRLVPVARPRRAARSWPWQTADDIGRRARRRYLRQIENDLAALPENADEFVSLDEKLARQSANEAEAQSERLLEEMAAARCDDLDPSDRQLVVAEALKLRADSGERFADPSTFPELLDQAREQAASRQRGQAARHGSASRLRAWAGPRSEDEPA